MRIEYIIYRPAGNDTAIVYGTNFSPDMKKRINDKIMYKHKNVEQVGFINKNGKKEIQMAGGEFCGNATRSAAFEYLNGENGKIKILVNSQREIEAGVDKNENAWCDIPIPKNNDTILEVEKGIYIVKIEGITMVVLQDFVACKYLKDIKDEKYLKEIGKEFVKNLNLENNSAAGVIFCEKHNSCVKINPIVWVKEVDTLFYETACGSGSTAVCMVEAFLSKQTKTIDIIQPSGLIITTRVDYENGQFIKATISGKVKKEKEIYYIDI